MTVLKITVTHIKTFFPICVYETLEFFFFLTLDGLEEYIEKKIPLVAAGCCLYLTCVNVF